jgi:hypothetical protein
MKYRILLPFLLSMAPSLLPAQSTGPVSAVPLPRGGACVIAKEGGSSQAIEWVLGERSVADAIEKAKRKLREQGYEYVFPQANSALPHGWLVIVKTEYRTFTGRSRTSYGCGFSGRSEQEAEELAIVDLQSFSWGWRTGFGYKVMQKQRY